MAGVEGISFYYRIVLQSTKIKYYMQTRITAQQTLSVNRTTASEKSWESVGNDYP